MNKKPGKRLTLDQTVTYQIKVPGKVEFRGTDWLGTLEISIVSASDQSPVTLLTGKLDQAALIGLLRRLYSLGLPLISVTWLEDA